MTGVVVHQEPAQTNDDTSPTARGVSDLGRSAVDGGLLGHEC